MTISDTNPLFIIRNYFAEERFKKIHKYLKWPNLNFVCKQCVWSFESLLLMHLSSLIILSKHLRGTHVRESEMCLTLQKITFLQMFSRLFLLHIYFVNAIVVQFRIWSS